MQKLPPINSTETTVKPVNAPPKGGGKTSLLTLSDLDGRTNAAKQAVAMRDAILNDLGGAEVLSSIKLALVDAVAIQTAIIEDAQVRWLRGDEINLSEISTLTNTRNRTAQIVGLDRVVKDITNLDAYLAS
ncbi:hypothetical protein [Aminobacter aminovorans]|uniref:hypothetical protein n=1 Tax=Aminobacter aminovorans TaxID=83263 RepID=UPI002860269D|nr:hypothetical protein [Aminobacter aminovorans]MDR7219867.1 hypothetical protein [Aminobacter aminovorans]